MHKILPTTYVSFGICQTWHRLTESHTKVNMLYKTYFNEAGLIGFIAF